VEADDQSKQKSKIVDKMQGMMKEVQNRLQQTQDVHGRLNNCSTRSTTCAWQNEEQRGDKQNKSTGSGPATSGDSAKVAAGGGPGGVPSGPPSGAVTGMSGGNN